ncbi:MAG: hypothetical protein ACKV2T_21275 [Kofleriaceae bacterium]
MRRRVWCEMLPFAELSPVLLEKLAVRRIELLLAVRPWQLAEIAGIAARVRAAGVYLGLWPMLGDEHGRWASVRSMVGFIALADEVIARVPDAAELVIDLEPPHEVLARWKALRPAFPTAQGYREARAALSAAIGRWKFGDERRRGTPLRVTTAVLPLLPLELRGEWIQRALGTPATALPVDAHNTMAYTSLYEGWSRGLVGRRRAEVLLAMTARLARWRFRERAAISLGCVGPGAFGDEPGYRRIDELARDVAIAARAGVEEIALFDLAGVVRRGDVDGWLDVLDTT